MLQGNLFGLSWLGMVIMALVWVAVIVIALVVGSRLLRTRPTAVQRVPSQAPLEVLRQRYARGEIDAPTFARMVAELEAEQRRN